MKTKNITVVLAAFLALTASSHAKITILPDPVASQVSGMLCNSCYRHGDNCGDPKKDTQCAIAWQNLLISICDVNSTAVHYTEGPTPNDTYGLTLGPSTASLSDTYCYKGTLSSCKQKKVAGTDQGCTEFNPVNFTAGDRTEGSGQFCDN